MMASYYDDNYGWYDIEDQDGVDFYHEVQQRSVEKKCVGCGRRVKIQPQYDVCNSCATKREQGWDF